MRLERQIVVRAALELLNKVGMDGLTTRRLAGQLGVQGPALYWHFKNKQELIDEMARALMADSFGQLQPGEDWAQWLADGARRMRRVLLSYRDGARLLAGHRPSGPHGRMDRALVFGPLREAGFRPEDTLWATLTVGLFTFGWTMDEQAASNRDPPFDPKFDPERGFEFGLSTIIAGLKARLAAQPPSEEPAALPWWTAAARKTMG